MFVTIRGIFDQIFIKIDQRLEVAVFENNTYYCRYFFVYVGVYRRFNNCVEVPSKKIIVLLLFVVMDLRKNKEEWLIGQTQSESLSSFNRLPTKKNVLARYSHLRFFSAGDSPSRDIFKLVLGELKEVWGKGGIPIRPDDSCLVFLLNLLGKKEKIRKMEQCNRKLASGKSHEKIAKFAAELEQLCDISALDAYEQLSISRRPKWKEDWKFYEDQKSERKYHMTGSIDRGVSNFFERQEERQLQDLNRRSCNIQKLSNCEIRELLESSTDGETEGDQSDDSTEFIPLPAKKRKTPLTATLEVSAKQLSSVTAAVADRCRLSFRQQFLLQSTIITKSGGELNNMSMSVATVLRQRKTAREKTVESIKADWEINKPKKAVLHWDSKLFHSTSDQNEERIAVLISGSLNG